jgi:hypothetical protein
MSTELNPVLTIVKFISDPLLERSIGDADAIADAYCRETLAAAKFICGSLSYTHVFSQFRYIEKS